MVKVLITGGHGDIAQAISKQLTAFGSYQVMLPDRNSLDVTNYNKIVEVVTNNIPDVLINNAGYIDPYNIADNRFSSEEQCILVNLLGTFWCAGVAASLNKNVIIVNIGSSAGLSAHAGWSSYSATKAGVIMATKCWAQEGLKAICVSPGRSKTKMRNRLFPDEDQNTLLCPDEFATIVIKAINGKYPWGANVNVNVSNIKKLLNE